MGAGLASELFFGDYRVLRFIGNGRWNENCYIVSHQASTELVIIDPGYDPESIMSMLQAELGASVRILLTHPHHDHIGAAAALCEALQVPCELHKADLRLLKHAPMYAQQFAGVTIASPENLLLFDDATFRSDDAMQVTMLHTPGHTRGGVCYLFPGFVFTGDTLLHSYTGRTDLPGGDPLALEASVSHLLATLPENTVILPGHRDPWDVAAARKWWKGQADCPPSYDFFENERHGASR